MSQTDGTATPVEPIPGETTEAPTEPITGTVEEAPQETPISAEADSPLPAEPADPEPPEEKRPFYRTTLGIVVIVLVILALLGLGGYAIYNNLHEDSVAGRMVPAPERPGPFVPGGVNSWVEYKTAADAQDKDKVEGNIMYESLALLHPEQGDIREAVAKMALLEKSGKSYMYVAPKGAAFINTARIAVDGKLDYRFFEDYTRNNSTKFLTFADQTIALKAGCANAVLFHKNVPGEKVSIKHGTKKPVVVTPPTKCTNQEGQYMKSGKQASKSNVGETDGYVRDNLETVTKQQTSEPKGGTTPTTKGTPGTDSGGTTPGGPGIGTPVPNPGAGETIGGSVDTAPN